MARIALNGVTTLNTGTQLDPMTLDLFGLRELISTPSYTAGVTFPAYTAANVKFTVDASYNFLVAKSTSAIGTVGVGLLASGRVSATADAAVAAEFNRLTSDGTQVAFYRAGTLVGSIGVTGAATSFNTTSDGRLKADVSPATEDSGALIDAMRVVSHAWKNGGERVRFGFVAQELVKVMPEAVRRGGDTPDVRTIVDEESGESRHDPDDIWGVDPAKLVAPLILEVQSLRKRLAALEKVAG